MYQWPDVSEKGSWSIDDGGQFKDNTKLLIVDWNRMGVILATASLSGGWVPCDIKEHQIHLLNCIGRLLAASTTMSMETAPMASKSWQPRHEPPCKREKQAPVTLIRQWEKEAGEKGGGGRLDITNAVYTMKWSGHSKRPGIPAMCRYWYHWPQGNTGNVCCYSNSVNYRVHLNLKV